MWNPGRIEKIGTTWLIHDAAFTGTSLLFPFPYALFPDVHEQEALLTHQNCNTAVSDMHDVVKGLLRGKSLWRHSREALSSIILIQNRSLFQNR